MYNGYLLTDNYTKRSWSFYIGGIFLWYPEGTPIVPRPRYTYIIILYNYNIIYIIFPRLLLFPSSTLFLGKILWPSTYFSKDSRSVCTVFHLRIRFILGKTHSSVGKKPFSLLFRKNPFCWEKKTFLSPSWLVAVWYSSLSVV